MFDLPTHEALADVGAQERHLRLGLPGRRDAGATCCARRWTLHFDTFKRILAERVADAAGIVEDGSTARAKNPPTYRDAAGVAHAGART